MAELPTKVPENVVRLIQARLPEPNLSIDQNPLVQILQAMLDELHAEEDAG